jgi:hypothetical protein
MGLSFLSQAHPPGARERCGLKSIAMLLLPALVYGSWDQLHTLTIWRWASECWCYKALLLLVLLLLVVALLLLLPLQLLLCLTIVCSDHCIHLLFRHITPLPLPLQGCSVKQGERGARQFGSSVTTKKVVLQTKPPISN